MADPADETSEASDNGPPEKLAHLQESSEQGKGQLDSLKEIMMKNQQSLKQKEEEAQEYARRLSKIKSRAKLSRRSKDGASSSKDSTPRSDTSFVDMSFTEDTVEDISQAKTPKARSSLLQRKLAENRKAFEQRSKEITESKRAVEEKVEAIRQQLDEKELSVTPVRPVVVTSDVMLQMGMQEKEEQIAKLTSRILDLEAVIMDLQENLREKDSVIESKTKAVTLMSADLSKKGKTTLDTLEDTKDEMRTMQEHFVLMETSLKNKNESLLEQLRDRDNKIVEMEDTIKSLEHQLSEQKQAESASADFSRSTMDQLAETKDAMKSMQENFVLLESSWKLKNETLLQSVQDYETKLREADERIIHLESSAGITRSPSTENLLSKIEKLEQANRQLQDEKFELQRNFAEMQDRIGRSMHGNGVVLEKDNRIAELENLIEELKRSNELLEEESKAKLQKEIQDLTTRNEEYSCRINDLEKLIDKLESEKNDIAVRLSEEVAAREDDKTAKLTKELEELNKSMIKIKAQHRSKVKNLQKQLEEFKKVSDTNAELVRLANQVAVLEEEKGNLQLSLVDFDELKATSGDWQERVADLEGKVSAQSKEIQLHIDAIAALENQKLDLMQELHSVKQEISALEAENAESENLRVTAEMKVVDLEEQLESLHRGQSQELLKKIETLTQENNELYSKLSKLEEKAPGSDSGSTESFEAIQMSDKNDLLRKIEDLTQKNNELTMKLSKFEKSSSHAGSTESFETINDTDKNELLKKIDQLTQENSDLMMKLSRLEEKGSSDTGSTESFEKIPEHNESSSKIELLVQENNDLLVKVAKLEEQLENMESSKFESVKESLRFEAPQSDLLQQTNNLAARVNEFTEENAKLQQRIEALLAENSELVIRCTKLEEQASGIRNLAQVSETESKMDVDDQNETSAEGEETLERKQESADSDSKLEALLKENAEAVIKATKLEELSKALKEDLNEVTRQRDELQGKIDQMMSDDFARERSELINKLEKLTKEKEHVAHERQELQGQISSLLQRNSEETGAQRDEPVSQELIENLEKEIKEYKRIIAEQEGMIEEMRLKLASKEEELREKSEQIAGLEISASRAEQLESELKEMLATMEEWKFKCEDMEKNMQALEENKVSIEKQLSVLQEENERLRKEKEEGLQRIGSLESTFGSEMSAKDDEIVALKEIVENLDREIHLKCTQEDNWMITIDNLTDQLNSSKVQLQEKTALAERLLEESKNFDASLRMKDEAMFELQKDIVSLHERLQKTKSVEEYEEVTEKLHGAEAEIARLKNEVNNLHEANGDLQRKFDEVTEQTANLQSQLASKEEEIARFSEVKEQLSAQITEMQGVRAEAEKWVSELQSTVDNSSKYNEELQQELKNTYKLMEQLKAKHVEDTEMQNRRLESVIEELNAKAQEVEDLKKELTEKEKLLETLSDKGALDAKVVELEEKLAESESKSQAQLEKMKKIAATLKKKTSTCQELEARVAELEEKWTTEKGEKEAKNRRIHEVESSMRDKDKQISELKEKLAQANNDVKAALANVEKTKAERDVTEEKMDRLVRQIVEAGTEMDKLHNDCMQMSTLLSAEVSRREALYADYESYKKKVLKERDERDAEFEEAKEKARELSVRMNVMECEYVGHLTLINNLRAENRLLSSKQTQINEKLENVEKESEERRKLIEDLRRELSRVPSTSQTNNGDEANVSAQHCERCEQCQTLIQALEAKLQEREAEIENLDNELSNSIGMFVAPPAPPVHRSLRYAGDLNEPSGPVTMDYLEMQREYDVMASSNEKLKLKLSEVLKENKKLSQKVSTLQERITGMEHGPSTSRQSDLQARYDEQQAELQNLRDRLEDSERSLNELIEEQRKANAQKNQELQRLQTDRDDLQQQVSTLTEKLSQRDRQLEEARIRETRAAEEPSKTQEKDDAPKLFDAAKIFGASSSESERQEVLNLQSRLAHKEIVCHDLKQTIQNLSREVEEAKTERDEMLQKYTQIVETMNSEAGSSGMQKLPESRDERDMSKDFYAGKVYEHDSFAREELERRVREACKEKELLQLQLNDLAIHAQELQDSLNSQRNLQVEYQNVVQQRDEAREMAKRLNETLESWYKDTDEKSIQTSSIMVHPRMTILEDWRLPEETQGFVDPENWEWNEENAQLAADTDSTSKMSTVAEDAQQRTRMENLQDRIRELEEEKAKLQEENEAVQLRSTKLLKKLKEYKAQMHSLQQQLKIQKSAGFCELDSAIEEELKSQISELEKTVEKLKEEQKNTAAEKEALSKRLDVVVSANERYMEMKEKQDMDMEVLRIQNKELTNKVETLGWKLQESQLRDNAEAERPEEAQKVKEKVAEPQVQGESELESLCKKYKEELDELKDEMEALASENEQLQHVLEEQKSKLISLEAKEHDDNATSKQNAELRSQLSKSKEDYELLRKQFEQSLMEANEQVSVMRQNSDLLKAEVSEKVSKLESEINELSQQLETSNAKASELQGKLEAVSKEKTELEKRVAELADAEKQLSFSQSSLTEVTELLNSRVREVAELKQELQKQYVEHKKSEDTFQNLLQQRNDEYNNANKNLEELRVAYTELENEVLRWRNEVPANVIEVEQRNQEIKTLTDRLATVQSAANELQTDLDNKKKEIEALRNNLSEKDSLLESTNSELRQLKDNLSNTSSKLSDREELCQRISAELQKQTENVSILEKRVAELEFANAAMQNRITELEEECLALKTSLEKAESFAKNYDQDLETYKAAIEETRAELRQLQDNEAKLKEQLECKDHEISRLLTDLQGSRSELEYTKNLLEEARAKIDTLQKEVEKYSGKSRHEPLETSIVDGLPLFRMSYTDNDEEIRQLRDQVECQLIEIRDLKRKVDEYESSKAPLNENDGTKKIASGNEAEEEEMKEFLMKEQREMVGAALDAANLTVGEQGNELELLRSQVKELSKDEAGCRDLRYIQEREQEMVRLQNEMHEKEQQINDLKFIIAEKDSQLRLQASMEQQSESVELERLTNELCAKEQETQQLKSVVAELQQEYTRLKNIEHLAEESREAIMKLSSEKEQIRLEAEEVLNKALQEKEKEIDDIKQRLARETERLSNELLHTQETLRFRNAEMDEIRQRLSAESHRANELQLTNNDLQNLKTQLEESNYSLAEQLREKTAELLQASSDLAEKERRLAELSITKDAELHNLKVLIHEKEVRIEELLALSEEEEKQLIELKEALEDRENEIASLKDQLNDKVREYETIKQALKKDVPLVQTSDDATESKENISSELDLALYMLHQSDVRCEELTQELGQLITERDILQLKLSNAIRLNEDLRKASSDLSPKKDPESGETVERSSSSKLEGPMETKESDSGEDKEALALKLSQLHTVSQSKDVRLKDERERRHTQQMSLLAHRDVLSTLPPEAAARIVNANYTLSRDVQSQSSVLLNWLWGKSTPKVVHM